MEEKLGKRKREMEKTKSNRKPQKFIVNLKDLPPIDPSLITPVYQDKYENPNSRNEHNVARRSPKEGTNLVGFDEVPRIADIADRNLRQDMKAEEDVCLSSTKLIDSNSARGFNFKRENENCHNNLAIQDAPKRVSAKSELHEICAANNWKLPLYECCKEEGPSHMKLFTFEVVVEIQNTSTTILECFSDPHSKKKMAAEHAAEGALWYLRHLGYFPPNKSKAC
ncbi:ribonuclease 3-like protein 1 [Herrania umbratica]|uniref:Ribonuclease 3-like protein 1 n=1 Tax=Herrania umbratica TaxID=108875 RepID=A0A6J1BFH4_9ROSI|nr:ribonuclease 3-like protein 1 [Herrania umbratica]